MTIPIVGGDAIVELFILANVLGGAKEISEGAGSCWVETSGYIVFCAIGHTVSY